MIWTCTKSYSKLNHFIFYFLGFTEEAEHFVAQSAEVYRYSWMKKERQHAGKNCCNVAASDACSLPLAVKSTSSNQSMEKPTFFSVMDTIK